MTDVLLISLASADLLRNRAVKYESRQWNVSLYGGVGCYCTWDRRAWVNFLVEEKRRMLYLEITASSAVSHEAWVEQARVRGSHWVHDISVTY